MNDQAVVQTVHRLNDSFFSSLGGDEQAVQSFLSSWAAFSEHIATIEHTLKPETLEAVNSLADTIHIVSSGVNDLQDAGQDIEHSAVEDVEKLVTSELDLDDAVSTKQPTYIEPCSRWLLNNLANPYPSESFRHSVATEYRCAKKDIDHWFVDARARIGWNKLRRQHFNNKRAEIVKAAKVFFLTFESSDLPPHIENEFAAVESNARSLFLAKLQETPLASKLANFVVDLTTGSKTQKDALCQQKQNLPRVARDVYPSPAPSPQTSSVPQLPPSSPAISSTPSRSLKRPRSPSEELSDTSRQRSKRQRSAQTTSSASCPEQLPSPASSVAELSATQASAPSIGKRKRRLSTSGENLTPKRPQHVSSGPRRQTVSDPFPISANVASSPELSFEEIINQFAASISEGIPSFTDIQPDPNAPLELELFDFSPFQNLESLPNVSSDDTSASPLSGNEALLPTLGDVTSSNQHSNPAALTEIPPTESNWNWESVSQSSVSDPLFHFDAFAFTNDSQPSDMSTFNPTPLQLTSYPHQATDFLYPPATLGGTSTYDQSQHQSVHSKELDLEAKRQRLLELERQANALRAELASS